HATGVRVVRPVAKPPDLAALASELANLAANYRDDDRLSWSVGHTQVRVNVGRIGPLTQGFRQTITGRRKRFGPLLDERFEHFAALGWQRTGRYNYSPGRGRG
ncbi:MAG: hypothetical protein ACREOA_08640, partial [Candidatus Dormibacteria bacterium]